MEKNPIKLNRADQMTQINYGKHFVSNDDIQSVNKVLRSNLLTQGKTVENLNKFKKISKS